MLKLLILLAPILALADTPPPVINVDCPTGPQQFLKSIHGKTTSCGSPPAVTGRNFTVGAGLSVTAGTGTGSVLNNMTVGIAAGYYLPSTADQTAWNAKQVAIPNIRLDTDKFVYKFPVNNQDGYCFEATSSGGQFCYSMNGPGTLYLFGGAVGYINFTGGWISFGETASTPVYSADFNENDNSTTPLTDVVRNSGSHNLSIVAIRNLNSTLGNYGTLAFQGAGSDSSATDSWISGIHDVHTNGAETGHLEFDVRTAGTPTTKMTIGEPGKADVDFKTSAQFDGQVDVHNNTDTLYGGFNLVGPLNNDYQTFSLVSGGANAFQIWNRHLNAPAFIMNYTGQVYLGAYAAGHPNASIGIKGMPGNTSFPTLVTQAMTSQTADIQDWVSVGEVTLASVDKDGNFAAQRVQVTATGAAPTCNSAARGTFFLVQGGAGVKDVVEVCAKDAADAYAWRSIY